MRYVVVVLLLMLGLPSLVEGASVPVILVAPPASAEVWGDSALGTGLLGMFLEQGYVREKNLFLLSLDPDRDADPYRAAEKLRDLAESIRATGDVGPINLVGYSLGGLTVCHYLKNFAAPGEVGTAVLVATPLEGSFLATYYRRQWEVLQQEALARGGFPWLSRPAVAPVPRDEIPAFASETDYVARRALGVYAPLYGQYVLENRWLGLPTWVSRTRSFETYLLQEHPRFVEEHLLTASLPPLGLDASLGAGHDLSRSFYELLALDSGRRLYLVERTDLADLAWQVLGDGYIPTSPQDALVHYGPRLAQALGERLLEASRAPLFGHLLGWLGERLGYEPTGAPLRRVQQLMVPLAAVTESDGSPGSLQVPVNYPLALWHQWREEGGGPRLVALASQVTNWLKPLVPTSTSNDLVVEVTSALPPPGPHDVFRVWSGLLRPDHFGLLGRVDVQEFIVQELDKPTHVTRNHSPLAARTPQKTWSWQESGRITTSSWRPSYIDLGPERLQGIRGEVYVQFQLPQPPEGGHWLITSGTHRERIEEGGEYRFYAGILHHEPLQVSVRPVLARNGPWGREFTGTVPYQVQFLALHFPMGPDTLPPSDAEPIRVVLRSKRTTSRHEERTYHDRWVWDMGDGTVVVSDDREDAHMRVDHVYHYPGTYQVQAVAYDNHGRLIRRLSWVEQVQQGSHQASFIGTSLIEPDVTIKVMGPVNWITGRPATFTVEVDVTGLPHTRREVVSVDPGVRFEVYWERPGFFTVEAAATVRVAYEFPEGVVTVTNTYVGSTTVRVLAPVITE